MNKSHNPACFQSVRGNCSTQCMKNMQIIYERIISYHWGSNLIYYSQISNMCVTVTVHDGYFCNKRQVKNCKD